MGKAHKKHVSELKPYCQDILGVMGSNHWQATFLKRQLVELEIVPDVGAAGNALAMLQRYGYIQREELCGVVYYVKGSRANTRCAQFLRRLEQSGGSIIMDRVPNHKILSTILTLWGQGAIRVIVSEPEGETEG